MGTAAEAWIAVRKMLFPEAGVQREVLV